MTAAPPRTPPTPRVVVRARRPPISARVNLRVLALTVLGTSLLLGVAAVAMSLGEFPITIAEVARATLGIGEVDDRHAFIVRTLRLPRVLTAILVGFALAGSGAVFQGLVRNPLVAPDVIGINAGAGLAAVFWIVTLQSTGLLPVAAFAGATATAFAVYVLTWRKGITGNRLVLVGIGANAILAALTTLLIVRYPIERVSSAVLWQTGTLYGSGWGNVTALALGVGLLLPTALWLMRRLQTIQLGDELARGLGVRVEIGRAGLIVVGSGLAAVAVAAGGPIGFVALISPHIARMLAGPLTGGVLVLAGVVGALMLTASDLVAQHAFSPISLPVGVVTAAVGAPYFLFLLYRTNRAI